jgi:hypothetical protein
MKLDPRARGQAKLGSNVEARGRPANLGRQSLRLRRSQQAI